MFKFFKKSSKKDAYIALDIGTEITKAMIFEIEEKRNHNAKLIQRRAIIKGESKVVQNKQKYDSSITDINKIIESTKEAIKIASRRSKLNPTKLIMGIGGDGIKGGTSIIDYKREDSESKINVTELRNILHKVQWKAFAEVRKKLSDETGHPEIDIKLINSFITEIRIDGYKVSNPLGFQGKEVKVSIFNSFAPTGHYEALQKIGQDLEIEVIGIMSEPFALSRCLSHEEEDLSAIFIDVGGNATDIGVIKNQSMISTRSFGIGGRNFTKRLSVELNISFDEADELKKAYTSEKLEQKSKKIISRIIKEDIEVWLEGVVLTISEFSEISPLPSRILLCGGGCHLPEIKKALNDRKWHKKLDFTHRPIANYLTPQNLKNIIDETKGIKGREDIMPLALVSLGLELSNEETIVQRMLKKIIGIMQV